MSKKKIKQSIQIPVSGTLAKGNITTNYVTYPIQLNYYTQLGLILPSDVLTYLNLIQYTNTEYGYAFPKITDLAKVTGMNDETVGNSVKRLEQAGLIIKEKKHEYGNKNIYYVFIPYEKEDLDSMFPELKAKNEQRIGAIDKKAQKDKGRLNTYQQKLEEADKQREALKAGNKVTPVLANVVQHEVRTVQDNPKKLEEEAEKIMLEKLAKL
ncbi:helix-turn-helix domain-containing protein [Bacillus toyonensis]|uniref:helix-turn-helix domain-containing protein n=1 Tax=Bacillus toyonensis TaxID=155322 RepID=UPI000BF413D0|nr:helix-turn-helix domain-containing protein [Bacillus toyonensis]PFW92695.1 helix-turn-helix domain-containing protein [Bacillus toyonensis]PFY46747.1 helix-turn-helix domain-containing protein [Bacillus toyonensis]PFY77926.1 helix-turn-helix domain-containing protein [Bacillus toyonensis]PGE93954.1 helix-turn-helix domain-containing protein [Bacillus toyonensis]PHA93279.1 helix-turn-helix domain-containing protein [Bacillus toyonensis]